MLACALVRGHPGSSRFGRDVEPTSQTLCRFTSFFGLIDRLYQYYRFGSFFNTYMSVVASRSQATGSSPSRALSV